MDRNIIPKAVLAIFSAAVAVPIVKDALEHTVRLEQAAILTGLVILIIQYVFLKREMKASLAWSIGCAVIAYGFIPLFLDNTPSDWIRPFVYHPYDTELYENLEKKAFLDITAYDNLTLDEAYVVIAKSNVPVLFRNLIRDPIVRGEAIIKRLSENQAKFRTQYMKPRPYDFFRGCNYETGHFSTISEVMNSENNEYISFNPILLKEEMVDIIGSKAGSKLIADNSFMSNFNSTVVTTFVHAAALSMSLSVQLLGRKTWFFWDPSVANAFNADWHARVSSPSHGNEKELFGYPAIRVTAFPGDVVSFPPIWFHVVVTHKRIGAPSILRCPPDSYVKILLLPSAKMFFVPAYFILFTFLLTFFILSSFFIFCKNQKSKQKKIIILKLYHYCFPLL